MIRKDPNLTKKHNIQWFGPHLAGDEVLYLERCLTNNYINDGILSRQVEQEISNFLGVKYALTVTNGTSALAVSLMALGIGVGDEVLVPNFTFAATANAVLMTGAKPILTDISEENFCISIESIQRVQTPSTKAVIAVDVNGRSSNYDQLTTFCDNSKLHLICDSAEALGSKNHKKYLGSFGKAGCFSFSANKTITSGQGGLIATNDRSLFNRAKEIKDQGRSKQGTGGDDRHNSVGFNFKFTDIQASFILAQLKCLKQRLKEAERRDALYRYHLSGINDLIIPNASSEGKEVLQWFDILTPKRDLITTAFKREKIQHRNFWLPLSQQKIYGSGGHFPYTKKISALGMWLPSRYDIKEQEIEKIAKTIKSA
ncbi:DegT/DnrJ/EryC1/StrS family aminotransferase [Gammaproteobacteria bacterium]|nr:DegT/DnrJ/EryC1/StrS family aminotransferase [Gammaproteobacteria bacterium]